MKKTLMLFLFLLVTVATPSPVSARAGINVVATTMELADWARQIGGDKVEVRAISTGGFDLHFFEPSPSHIMALRRADLLVIAGMDLDVWVRELIDASRNPNLRFGRPGFVDVSDGIIPIEIPATVNAGMGHVHPQGNPHYWFTPHNVKTAVNNIYEGLARIAPENADYFKENRDRYFALVDAKFSELKKMISPFENTKVLQYHKTWEYFCGYFGLDIFAPLEPLPGIPPSARHLSDLVSQARSEKISLLIAEPYYSNRPVNFIRDQIPGIKILRLSHYMGSVGEGDTYLDHLEYLVEEIVKALEE